MSDPGNAARLARAQRVADQQRRAAATASIIDQLTDEIRSLHGFETATKEGLACGLCQERGEDSETRAILPGDVVRKLPATWSPGCRSRWGHEVCIRRLMQDVEASTGVRLIP